MSSVSIIEPDGIVKACTTKARITRARSTATTIASPYSRTRDLRRGRAISSTGAGAGAASGRVSVSFTRLALQHRQERLLGNLDAPDLLHSLLAFLLLLEQLPFARDVSAVALGGDVLAHGLDRLAGDHAAADRGLDRHLVELAGDDPAELLHERLALLVCLVPVRDDAERVDGVPVEQDVELDELRLPELEELVVERRVPARHRLQLVVE